METAEAVSRFISFITSFLNVGIVLNFYKDSKPKKSIEVYGFRSLVFCNIFLLLTTNCETKPQSI